jgi:acyl carrier protein
MSIKDPRGWLIDWFVRNAGLSAKEIAARTKENFLQAGWIDSLKFVNFILEIEGAFGIHFSNEDFQDREFVTLDGLVRYISQKGPK